MSYREHIWQRLATDLKPSHLSEMARAITLDEVTEAVGEILQGRVKGRVLVSPH